MIDDPDIAAIRERCSNATPGPWHYRPNEVDDWGTVRGSNKRTLLAIVKNSDLTYEEISVHFLADTDPYGPDAAFIAHARTDIPALCTALDARDAEIAALRERLRGIAGIMEGAPTEATARGTDWICVRKPSYDEILALAKGNSQ